ncbi:hypothetical protein [Fimbriiglobus ruber]|uniref:Helix-turn-helix domain-containing protein n=1 Tax=Fimbriiglobus ruber TaxID=1908690 RepID=A0A225DY19_9BACT|nr:hypothetical protein [Fimbriiglobus ruber]OWK45833.1 hypothetical protein FRUB_02164 [Fimbriiglobus ruber]
MKAPVPAPAGPADDAKPVLTPDAAAARLGLNRLTVMGLMAAGRLKSVDIGTGRRTHRRTSEAWLREFLLNSHQVVKSSGHQVPESS